MNCARSPPDPRIHPVFSAVAARKPRICGLRSTRVPEKAISLDLLAHAGRWTDYAPGWSGLLKIRNGTSGRAGFCRRFGGRIPRAPKPGRFWRRCRGRCRPCAGSCSRSRAVTPCRPSARRRSPCSICWRHSARTTGFSDTSSTPGGISSGQGTAGAFCPAPGFIRWSAVTTNTPI